MDQTTQPPATPPAPAAVPAPQQTATPQAAIPAAANVIKATPVLVYASQYILLNARPGLLVWNKNNTIQLFASDNQELILQCTPTDIKVFSYWSNRTVIKLKNGQVYTISINTEWMRLNLAANLTGAAAIGSGAIPVVGSATKFGGLLGSLGYDVQSFMSDSKNDSAWWVTSLKNQGVNAKRMTQAKLAVYVILGLIGALVLVSIIIGIVQGA